MKVTYKYKIGQKVKLVSINHLNSYYLDDKDCEDILNKEVTIINRGFKYTDDMYSGPHNKEKLKLTVFYYIAEEPSKYNKTMFYESCFEGEDSNDVINEKPMSSDGTVVKIGTKIYYNILENIEGKIYTNCIFTFASEGPCVSIYKNYRSWDSSYDPTKDEDLFMFESCREFLCQGNYNGKIYECGDARRYGHRDSIYDWCAYTKLPKNYVELFVDTLLDKDCFYGGHSLYDKSWSWEIEQWLRHFGVWEQIKELYDKRVPKETEPEQPEEKDNKLSSLLAGLSDEEREKLKSML